MAVHDRPTGPTQSGGEAFGYRPYYVQLLRCLSWPVWSGRSEARFGLRMMPTNRSPRPLRSVHPPSPTHRSEGLLFSAHSTKTFGTG
jgi:hypothetical protein